MSTQQYWKSFLSVIFLFIACFGCGRKVPDEEEESDILFCEGFEEGMDSWAIQGQFDLCSTTSHSGSYSLVACDTVDSAVQVGSGVALIIPRFNLNDYSSATLSFWNNLGGFGYASAGLMLEYRTNNRDTIAVIWRVMVPHDSSTGWNKISVELDKYCNEVKNGRFYFQYDLKSTITMAWILWAIDDVKLIAED